MTTDDTAAPMPDAGTIHARGLERARRIIKTYRESVLTGGTPIAEGLAVAFQAAADALHEEADAAAEARRRGHQSLTKDLRNTAGRIVGIAQDLMELSKMDSEDTPAPVYDTPPAAAVASMAERIADLFAVPREMVKPATPDIGSHSASHDLRQPIDEGGALGFPADQAPLHYTPATDPVIEQADVSAHLARLEAERAAGRGHVPDYTVIDETHTTTTEELEQIKAYLRGETDVPPTDIAPDDAVAALEAVHGPDVIERTINAYTNTESPYYRPLDEDAVTGVEAMKRELVQPNPFLDPEPYRPSVSRPPFPGAEQHRYDYAALMTPVPADRVPAHWSWSQLTTLEDCGVQYRGQRLDGIPQQPQWANVGGTTFHAVTEAFDRGAWAAGGADLLPEVHPELIKQRWEDAFAAEINRAAAETGIEMGEVGDNWRASNGGKEGYTFWLIEGERMLELYIHNRRKLDKAGREAGTLAVPLELLAHIGGPSVPVIEYQYERKLDGPTGTLTIKGIIDRAYRCADGSIMIKDLKTGRMPVDTAQLGEYAWAIIDLGVTHPEDINLLPKIMGCFYDARKAIFTDPVDLLEKHPYEEYVYRYHAAEAARRAGVFMPHRSTFCAGCSIRYACPVGGA